MSIYSHYSNREAKKKRLSDIRMQSWQQVDDDPVDRSSFIDWKFLHTLQSLFGSFTHVSENFCNFQRGVSLVFAVTLWPFHVHRDLGVGFSGDFETKVMNDFRSRTLNEMSADYYYTLRIKHLSVFFT